MSPNTSSIARRTVASSIARPLSGSKGNNCEAHLGILDIFAPSDPELVKKTLARIDEQDKWNDVFSTKLIELLDNIDGLKKDIRERMRRAESVRVAESMLLDEAARTETLNTKLAETHNALDLVRQEFQGAKFQYTGDDG